jgi:hypothetical protein
MSSNRGNTFGSTNTKFYGKKAASRPPAGTISFPLTETIDDDHPNFTFGSERRPLQSRSINSAPIANESDRFQDDSSYGLKNLKRVALTASNPERKTKIVNKVSKSVSDSNLDDVGYLKKAMEDFQGWNSSGKCLVMQPAYSSHVDIQRFSHWIISLGFQEKIERKGIFYELSNYEEVCFVDVMPVSVM